MLDVIKTQEPRYLKSFAFVCCSLAIYPARTSGVRSWKLREAPLPFDFLMILACYDITVAYLGPPRKVRKHFWTRYTVKNEISNLHILLKSVLKMHEMPFQRPKFQNGISNLYILLKSACPQNAGNAVSETQISKRFQGPPTIVSSLWPPPH